MLQNICRISGKYFFGAQTALALSAKICINLRHLRQKSLVERHNATRLLRLCAFAPLR
jgi:hypothetical protein